MDWPVSGQSAVARASRQDVGDVTRTEAAAEIDSEQSQEIFAMGKCARCGDMAGGEMQGGGKSKYRKG